MEQEPAGFNVHTGADVQAMLQAMGLRSIEDRFADVPPQVRLQRALDLPEPLSEWALMRDVRAMAARNSTVFSHACYLGGGAYAHYIPAVVEALCSRGEFLTAYTPYQPEMSQGLLQALFEFQTLMGRLLGAECVNCSVYDGATALAEAGWMLCSASGRRRLLVSQAVWAQSAEVLRTYLLPRGVTLELLPLQAGTGRLDGAALQAALAAGEVAGVLVQTPNALGVIEDVQALAAPCRAAGTSLCVAVYPWLCGWLEAPGALGADIVVCEGQPLGLALQAGGPYVGIIACVKRLERYLPGRLVGRMHDLNGKLGYALVKEDREQHVARDKATSHICSNQALNALRVAVFLAALGERNFMRLARHNAGLARQLHVALLALPGVQAQCSGDFFNEFALALPVPAGRFVQAMQARGIFAGTLLPRELAGHERGLLVAVTETRSPEDLQAYVEQARQCLEALQ